MAGPSPVFSSAISCSAFVWLVVYLGAVFLTSSETGWVDLVLLLGGFCWLGAAALIVSWSQVRVPAGPRRNPLRVQGILRSKWPASVGERLATYVLRLVLLVRRASPGGLLHPCSP